MTACWLPTRRLFLCGVAAAPLAATLLPRAGLSQGTVVGADTDAADEGDALFARMAEPFLGDLDGMVQRGFIRVGVAYGPLFFTADGPDASGLTVDVMREFEADLRKRLGTPARHLTLVLAPLPRDRMFPLLLDGKVDLLAANLTVTPERSAVADFSDPFIRNVREVVVGGPATAQLATLDDLHLTPLHVRRSSSYFEHLTALSAARQAAGAPALTIVEADPNLEDEDIIELVSLGVIPATVVDDHKAKLFVQIFEAAVLRDDLVVNEGGDIAWAMRKTSPKLKEAANAFVKVARQGTTLGNTLLNRYVKDTDRVRNAMANEDSDVFAAVIGTIREKAASYDFDALMIAAQAYQESRLRQSARSAAGAVGVMQVLPSTARDPAIGIHDISTAERNIEAGVKYLRLLRREYLDDPAISAYDQTLMAFAAYNAGPGNLRKARTRAARQGLDPNVWFGNVELAMAQAVSREPVVYVRNILKYYTTYRLAEQASQRGG
jgi:membrane-bound lytic murein transglycosylase MltF